MSVEEQLQPGEEILYRAHVTRISLVPLAALGAVVLAGGLFLWQITDEPIAWMAAGVVAAGVGLVLGWKYLLLAANEYVLTNRRVVQQTGLVAKRSVDSQLDKINNVEHRQTLWGRLLGYGDVEIDTASETGTTLFARISRPLDFKRAILAAREQYRTSYGPVAYATPPAVSGAERLRQLKALLDDGLISQEEYEMKRRQLLAEL